MQKFPYIPLGRQRQLTWESAGKRTGHLAIKTEGYIAFLGSWMEDVGILRALLQQWEPRWGWENHRALIKPRGQAKYSGHTSADATARSPDRPDEGPIAGTSGHLEDSVGSKALYLITTSSSHTTPNSTGQEEHLNFICVPHTLSPIWVENAEPEGLFITTSSDISHLP